MAQTQIEPEILEQAKPIQGFPNYRITKCGMVISNYTKGNNRKPGNVWREKTPDIGNKGYGRVTLYDNAQGKKRRELIHTLVLETFIGPRPSKEMECAHRDGNRQNNRLENLRWATPQENWQDRREHNGGDGCYGTKLNREKAEQIRELLKTTEQKKIAKMFGITQAMVSRIKMGHVWKPLTPTRLL